MLVADQADPLSFPDVNAIRQNLVDWLERHGDPSSQGTPTTVKTQPSWTEKCEEWPAYIVRMRQNGEFCDEKMAMAASAYYRRPIHIVSSATQRIIHVELPTHWTMVCSGPPLTFGHYHEIHYVATTRK